MKRINIDYSNVLEFLREEEIYGFQDKVMDCHNMLHNRTGLGRDYLGWVDLPSNYDMEEFKRVKTTAQKIKEQSDVFIVIGIGGSYLGAKAAIEMLNHRFYNELSNEDRGPKIYFLGQNISQSYLSNLMDIIEGKHISINVISKSGTTTEPAIAFRILKKYMEDKYGKDANKRIYVTTDKNKGALKALAHSEGYEQFAIPDDVGGRYSVLTSVGLLPMAVSGIDIDEVIRGAKSAYNDLHDCDLHSNHCYQYAVIRNILYNKGKTIEIMASYEPNLLYFGEWFKQLFGESEGKERQGIFPNYLTYTTDLHSMGQYVQDGRREIFETILNIDASRNEIIIETIEDDLDGLNYLSGRTMDYINKRAMEGTIIAHVKGGVPNIIINIPEISPYYFGYMAYFFQKVCGLSGYLLGVNPFDQPGVEEYKSNMFKLLGKK